MMERARLTSDHNCRVLIVRPGAVRIDGYLDPELDSLECIFKKWSGPNTEVFRVLRGDQLKLFRIGTCLADSHSDLGTRNRKGVDHRIRGGLP